jgi:spore coat protein CotH
MDFARLLTHADKQEFARRVGEFLDLDEFSRFLAGLVLLSSYDGLLSDGQNFYLYLDTRSNRFGFIPWDLDAAWGEFPFVGTPQTREQASIWHPWAGPNRFLERVITVEEFRRLYRARLEEMLATVFKAERLWARIDELAGAIREPVAAESDFRARRFELAVSRHWLPGNHDRQREGPRSPPHQLKRFIENRAKSVRDQLDGKSEGTILRFGQGGRNAD